MLFPDLFQKESRCKFSLVSNFSDLSRPFFYISLVSYCLGVYTAPRIRTTLQVFVVAWRRWWRSTFHNPAWLEPLHWRDVYDSRSSKGLSGTQIISSTRGDSLQLLTRHNYAVLYDTNLRMSLWCGYYLTDEHVKWARRIPRSPMCFNDNSLSREARLSSLEMQRKHFDKGHLAPHASVATCSVTAFEASLLSNMVLQHKLVNRGVWKHIENLTRLYVSRSRRKKNYLCIKIQALLYFLQKKDETILSLRHENTKYGGKCLAVSTGVLFKTRENLAGVRTVEGKKAVYTPEELYIALWDVHSHDRVAFIVPNNNSVILDNPELTRRLKKASRTPKKIRLNSLHPLSANVASHSLEDDLYISRFRVSIEELERRITESDRLINERGKTSATKASVLIGNNSRNISLFPLQKRRHALRNFILTLGGFRWWRAKFKLLACRGKDF